MLVSISVQGGWQALLCVVFTIPPPSWWILSFIASPRIAFIAYWNLVEGDGQSFNVQYFAHFHI